MAIKTNSNSTANHLVLFVHGCENCVLPLYNKSADQFYPNSHDGHPQELNYVSTQLKQKYPHRVIAYSVKSFVGKTHDGIDRAGLSVAQEVRDNTIS
jgi:hypothetical protein